MSFSGPLSEKLPRRSFTSLSRSKISGNRSANESHQCPVPRNPRHQYLPSSKELLKDFRGRTLTFTNISTSNVQEERGREAKPNLAECRSQSFSTSLADHESTKCSPNKGTARLDDSRIIRERNIYCARELRSALLDLNAASNNLNRRLDDTYYSVLEKLSSLQCTIMSLRELATMTRQLNPKLVSETNNVAQECEDQIDSFGNFQEQANRIIQLKKRVDVGRQKFLHLGERVNGVRKRVESWETIDQEWHNRLKRRLRILWSFLGTFLTTILALYALPWWMARVTDGELVHDPQTIPTNISYIAHLNFQTIKEDTSNIRTNIIGETKNQNWERVDSVDVLKGFD